MRDRTPTGASPRVAISLASLVPGTIGGSERYARQLLQALAAHPEAARVTVLVPPAARAAYGRIGDGALRVRGLRYGVAADGLPRALGLCAGLALSRPLARAVGPADVIHHPLTVPLLRPAAPAVITLHDVAHHEVPQLFGAAERAFRRIAYDAAARRAAAVVTPSTHSRDTIVAQLGVAPERVAVIPYGVEPDEFGPDDPGDDDRRRAPFDLPPRYVLYPANLWPHKNHQRLIQAWARLADRELALVLTGRVDQRLEPLLAEARRLGVGDRVRHLGHVDAGALPALYRGARAVVFPSLFEGFGFPVLEAMACGVPVAAAERASLPELCAGAAVLFDPEDVDAIAAATERAVEDGRLRAAGLRRAAELTWSAVADRHVELYRSVASRP